MQHHQIPVDGGHVSAVSVGIEGPALIFIHGWALDQRMWRPQHELAQEGFRVITYDRRGFGRSTAPPNLNLETEDIGRILDFFGQDSASLIGMSQGGRIALRFAHLHPARVTRLALQSAPIDGFPTSPEAAEAIPIAHYAELLRRGKHRQFTIEWGGHPLVHFDHKLTPGAIDEMTEAYTGADLLSAPQDGFTENIYEHLPDFDMPMLYISGDHDTKWLHSVAKGFRDNTKNGNMVSIAYAGHFSNMSQPECFNKTLLDFMQSKP